MTQGVIYMVDGEGLRRMKPSAPENENRMQELVARYPELITDGDGDLLLIRREHPIGDGEGEARWSVDHLFVTQDAIPVLVELKRAVDTRLRREVVGQILDYAANATLHWQPGTIAQSFAREAGADHADAKLAQFIGDRSAEEFWKQVDTNLRDGRIKLVFVADEIPRELARIVEFLNDQMRADVRAVELRWFSGEGGVTTLSPRIIGETQRAAATKSSSRALAPISVDEWISTRLANSSPETREAAHRFVQLIESEGGEVAVPSTQGSIISQFPAESGKVLYPFSIAPNGMLKLLLAYLINRPAFAPEEVRSSLYTSLEKIVGPLHTRSLSGEPGFKASLLIEPEKEAAVRTLLREILKIARAFNP